MKIERNFGLSFSFEKDNCRIDSKKIESTPKKQKVQNLDEILADMDFISILENEKNSKVDFEKLPNGISRYEHKGARYTIFKHDEIFNSEFYCPKGTSRGEFFNSYSFLRPEKNSLSTQKTKIEDINGEIDEKVLQGNSGDCWLLVAVNSLSSTKKGKQIIKDSIAVNDDNTVTVSFRGIGVSYTLSLNEISRYDTDKNPNDSYSNGDNDMLAFELATEKLFRDINLGLVNLDSKNENITDIDTSIENGGLPSTMFYFLTGIESDEYFDLSDNEINNIDSDKVLELLNKAQNTEDYTFTFGIYNGVHTAKLTDGSEYSLDVSNGGHALSIKNIDKNTVTFVNPWDNSIEYTMTKEEFSNFGIGYISFCDLSETKYKEEIVDMSGYTKNNTEDKTDENFDSFNHEFDYDYIYDYNHDYKYDKHDYIFDMMIVFDKFVSFLNDMNDLFKKFFFNYDAFSNASSYNRRL